MAPQSIIALPTVGLSLLTAVATWALVQASGDGDELEKVNYAYGIALGGVIVPAVFYLLSTWFVPSEFATAVLMTFRALRAVLGIGMLASICGLSGFLVVFWIGSENIFSLAAIMFCLSLIKYGLWLVCVTLLASGIIGIAIDLFVVASRVRLPKAKCR